MATITNSNLYPPIVDTYMPAFLIDGDNELKKICRVYFSISSFNSISEIKNAQVSLANQNTNISVLNTKKYPCGIKITPIYEDITKTSEDRYYIELEASDLEPEYGYDEDTGKYTVSKFNINEYYKVQIRFTSAAASDINIGIPPIDWNETEQKYNDAQAIDSWLTLNLDKFSEWSTVCLIRGISSPILSIKGLDASAESTTWSAPNVELVGTLSFLDSAETETLKSYRIKLFDSTGELLIDSGDLYSSNYVNVNEIKYTFKYNFQDGESYSVQIIYITKNLYSEVNNYNFTIVEGTAEALEATISIIEDINNGRLGVNVKGLTENVFVGNITIRRTSNESNFTLWEDVMTTSIEGIPLNYTWYDYTIKSGVWYKYCAQRRDALGNRGIVLMSNEPHMILFDDIFLNAEGAQLNIKFNPQISSFKRTVAEAKTDTIGSKYPFIKRNGYMNYREFSLGGLITCFMNSTETFERCDDSLVVSQGQTSIYGSNNFASKEKIYGDSLDLYNDYNKKYLITDFNDFTYERDFRERVLDFLYKNNVKLFRSATEGNILVKLMNISLTPDTVSGRKVYSFTCTAYEIDDFTLENCSLYNIAPLGEYKTVLEFQNEYIGQLSQTFPAYKDVFTTLNEKYAEYAEEGYEIKIEHINYLRIEINSDPYLIQETESGPVITTDATVADYTGYLVYINDNPIIIDSGNGRVYELKGDNIKVTSIVFAAETDALIDYNIIISQSQQSGTSVATANYYQEVGQLYGTFQINESAYQQIWNKYYEETESYVQKLAALKAVKIEADPGSIVYIQEADNPTFEKHIIGDTCLLEIANENSIITGMYFTGVQFVLASEEELARETLEYNRYAIAEGTYASLDVIVPKINHVYTLNAGNRYIWYKEAWWAFSESQEISCPIEAIIDYYCEIVKGTYA